MRAFVETLTHRQGQRLGDWLQQVDTNGAPALRSVESGRRDDLDAVIAGLTTDYTSGAVEGSLNRINM